MQMFRYKITDEVGIHARPAGMMVNKVKALGVPVTLEKDGKKADGAKLFAIMALAVKCGDTVTVTVDGDESAAHELETFFKENL